MIFLTNENVANLIVTIDSLSTSISFSNIVGLIDFQFW